MLIERPDVCEALDQALIGHLTAVSATGQPQTTPVWFLRDGDELIVYNRPSSPRLRSLAANERVSFVLRCDVRADGAVIIEGRAAVDESMASADERPDYIAKYSGPIADLGWTPESFAADYNVGLVIIPTRLRAWSVEKVMQADVTEG